VIPAGRVSNEIVHELDTFTTFAKIAGATVPQDRPIDGVDQTEFLLGKEKSNREGILLFCADRLQAVKWRNWKLHLYNEQRDWFTPPLQLGTPKLFNVILDPKEEYPVTVENTWAVEPMTKMISAFEASKRQHPLIAPGMPDPYTPPK
jgi:arylsulfatase